MKINSITEAMRFVSRVREKPEDSPAQQQRQGQQDSDGRSGREEQHKDPTPEDIDAAVHAFGQDAQAQANGLNALTVGTGPGLRVVLKDGGGAVVRQFTGEEFLKLREAVHQGPHARGKILDQKL